MLINFNKRDTFFEDIEDKIEEFETISEEEETEDSLENIDNEVSNVVEEEATLEPVDDDTNNKIEGAPSEESKSSTDTKEKTPKEKPENTSTEAETPAVDAYKKSLEVLKGYATDPKSKITEDPKKDKSIYENIIEKSKDLLEKYNAAYIESSEKTQDLDPTLIDTISKCYGLVEKNGEKILKKYHIVNCRELGKNPIEVLLIDKFEQVINKINDFKEKANTNLNYLTKDQIINYIIQCISDGKVLKGNSIFTSIEIKNTDDIQNHLDEIFKDTFGLTTAGYKISVASDSGADELNFKNIMKSTSTESTVKQSEGVFAIQATFDKQIKTRKQSKTLQDKSEEFDPENYRIADVITKDNIKVYITTEALHMPLLVDDVIETDYHLNSDKTRMVLTIKNTDDARNEVIYYITKNINVSPSEISQKTKTKKMNRPTTEELKEKYPTDADAIENIEKITQYLTLSKKALEYNKGNISFNEPIYYKDSEKKQKDINDNVGVAYTGIEGLFYEINTILEDPEKIGKMKEFVEKIKTEVKVTGDFYNLFYYILYYPTLLSDENIEKKYNTVVNSFIRNLKKLIRDNKPEDTSEKEIEKKIKDTITASISSELKDILKNTEINEIEGKIKEKINDILDSININIDNGKIKTIVDDLLYNTKIIKYLEKIQELVNKFISDLEIGEAVKSAAESKSNYLTKQRKKSIVDYRGISQNITNLSEKYKQLHELESNKEINTTIGAIISFIEFNKKVNPMNNTKRIDISKELKNLKELIEDYINTYGNENNINSNNIDSVNKDTLKELKKKFPVSNTTIAKIKKSINTLEMDVEKNIKKIEDIDSVDHFKYLLSNARKGNISLKKHGNINQKDFTKKENPPTSTEEPEENDSSKQSFINTNRRGVQSMEDM